MKKILLLIIALLMVVSLSGCGKKTSDKLSEEEAKIPDPEGDVIDSEESEEDRAIKGGGLFGGIADKGGSKTPEGSIKPEPGNQNNPTILPGQITVAAYNDNDHFDFWKSLVSDEQEKGQFKTYYDQYAFKSKTRLKITLPSTVPTKVSLLNKGEVESSIHTDANGICYLYPEKAKEEYQIKLEYYKNNKLVSETKTITGDSNFELVGDNLQENIIQIMFVIDATGSMADEMNYIKAEVDDTISKIAKANKGAKIDLAIMVYRDKNDKYVTRYSDFTSDISLQQQFLKKQSAQGGGDRPEAVSTALDEAGKKQWQEKAKTKLIIHVADAPSHNEEIEAWKNTTNELSDKGINIITVASSGVDKKTEYLFRSQSIISNGTYLYITNDSGIGGNHIEATVETKPVIEYLNDCLVRVINGYHTGKFSEPVYYGNTIRTDGE